MQNLPPPPQFVQVGKAVMQAGKCVAVATSNNFALRIANALNQYKPGKRGY